jgi:hypothetical protein
MSSVRSVCLALIATLALGAAALGQTENATVAGRVSDGTGAAVVGADVEIQSVERGTTRITKTNETGVYVLSGIQPGQYRMVVRREGFRQVDLLGLVVNVQDRIDENFRLQVGSVSESVTVNGSTPLVNTQDASVSTVVDRNFADNLPLNGRSFQTLINLTPGVVPVAIGGNNGNDSGQFSVNGQRAAANYWTVDGVSANASIGVEIGSGNQISGSTGVTSVFGGTNSLVPVDDMQEFRIQTSTFAPEFGRTPGAQISIVTRSGTNAFHGSAFDYLRNDVLDSNNWFNGFTNTPPLPKAEERQNDFGGTFGGPILKDRTFFFFSYEGLRLRLPTTAITTVPDAAARQAAVPAMQPILNAFPLDPNQPDLGNGIAQFNASYSDPGTLNVANLRIDHRLNNKIAIFARYNYSPSKIVSRGGANAFPLSVVNSVSSESQQLTSGLVASLSPRLVNELRFNYTRTSGDGIGSLDSFGNAVPFAPTLPSPYSLKSAQFEALVLPLANPALFAGPTARNVQRQFNVVDTIASQLGSHSFRAGVDYRRLTPTLNPVLYQQVGLFLTMNDAENGQSLENLLSSRVRSDLLFRNLSVFGQDTWRVSQRLTMTYGIRWDTDFAPSTTSGPTLPALSGFSPNDFSRVTLAPSGTPPFHTEFGNVAPRVGVAYQLSERSEWSTVARGGFGVFYDLATSETANTIGQTSYPFSATTFTFGGTFPPSGAAAAPPVIAAPTPSTPQEIASFDPNLHSPYTLQWNISLEQGLGTQQSLSLSYVGAAGRRLLQTSFVNSGSGSLLQNPQFSALEVVQNSATSDYDALQIQFQRRMVKNLQLLASYTWSHSIDTASAGSAALHSNSPSLAANSGDRASSDFDVRHAFSLGATYTLPIATRNRVLREITHGWSLQNIVQTHTAPPVSVNDRNFFELTNGASVQIRPDVVPGIPLYLYGPQYPGGKAFNNTPGAVAGGCPDGSMSVGPFCPPPIDANFNPTRQGDAGRNLLRGFGLFQWDLGVHRDFPIHESLTLQFRAEMFNVLNHPNFAPPEGNIASPNFGLSSQMLGQFLGGTSPGQGGLSSIYSIGSPRSVQLALKLSF